MNKQAATIIGIIVAIILVLIIFRACQRTKEIEITQKSDDLKSKFIVEVEKEPMPENNQ